jgi:hypothetical protein
MNFDDRLPSVRAGSVRRTVMRRHDIFMLICSAEFARPTIR